MNIASTKDISINVINTGIVRYFTSFAISRQSQRKNPAFPIPSTMIIIPKMKMMVDQLIPDEDASPSATVYQKLA